MAVKQQTRTGHTKGRPVTPGSIVGDVKVCWSNDSGTVSVQLALGIREKNVKETRRNNVNNTI